MSKMKKSTTKAAVKKPKALPDAEKKMLASGELKLNKTYAELPEGTQAWERGIEIPCETPELEY